MKTIEIEDKHAELLNEIGDLDSNVRAAIQRYLMEQIGNKVLYFSEQNKRFAEKYGMSYIEFSEKVASDENYIIELEQKHQIMMWEADLMDWEFSIKSIEDWKQKLENILTV